MEEGEDDSNSRALKGLENSVDGIKDNVRQNILLLKLIFNNLTY